MKNIYFILTLCSILLSASLVRADLVIDVSGADGHNGSDGRDGIFAGSDGTNAGHSSAGQNAGDINVRLTDLGGGNVGINGSHSRTFSVGTAGRIVLKANGGRGGNGGNGGDGATGSTGSRGSDATTSSNGTDGGRGGDGGDGGDGTSGSNGGAAGTITVTVREQDMRLLYLMAIPEVHGGPGGQGGHNGSGGAGGSGGPGGSSHSWDVPYQSTCPDTCPSTCPDSRTVDNGNGGTTTINFTVPCRVSCETPCTKYHHLSNPGGGQGPSGSSGSSGNAYITNGSDGHNGNYRFLVEYNDGRIESYQRPFNVAVTGFQLASDLGNDFVEPGERVTITGITLSNNGGMPSPTLTPLNLRGDANTENIVSGLSILEVQQSIPAGGSITVTGPLVTEILRSSLESLSGNPGRHLGGPQRQFNIAVSTEIVGINRYPNRLSYVRGLNLRFPIAISQVLGRRSIGQGDDYMFRWALNNYSNRQVGSQEPSGSSVTTGGAPANNSRGVRFVSSFAFSSGRNSGTYALEVRGGSPNASGSQNVSSGSGGVTPRESSMLWARLAFTNQAQLLDEGTLRVALEIEDPYNRGQWRQADVAYFPVKVGSNFTQTPGATALLVINPQTSASELDAWRRLMATSNRICDVWDVGIMGPLDLNERGLAQHYEGGTIVVLNDLIHHPGDESVPADAMFRLAPSDFIGLARQHHISLFIYDRTGSYQARAGGFGTFDGRTADSAMFVAIKVNQNLFRSPDYITGLENRVSLSMALSFNRKIEEFVRASRLNTAEGVVAAKAYLDAIAADLGVEQIRARVTDHASRADFPLLAQVVRHGLLPAMDASRGGVIQAELPRAVLTFIARFWFLAESQTGLSRGLNPWQIDRVAEATTKELLNELLARTFLARDGFMDSRAQNDAYDHVEDFIEARVHEFRDRADILATHFSNNDHSRFFRFPRRWNGEYFRQAAYSLILSPVYDRTYTHRLDLFNVVMERDRVALPAFN